jgi:photosystem II stability/assembly factor-like uncharacterized protein
VKWVLLAFALAGCSQGIEISHVHGLAYLDGDLFVGTHHGLARLSHGEWQYLGAAHDYMGLTQGPGVLYASGHPADPRAYGSTNLGLLRSTDGGQSWQQLLQGPDFHALTSWPDRDWVMGFWQGMLKLSRDAGVTWEDRPAPSQVLALEATSEILLAGTTQGLLVSRDAGMSPAGWTAVGRFGAVTSVAAAADGSVYFLSTGDGRSGGAYRSTDLAVWLPLEHAELRASPAPVQFVVDPVDSRHVFASTFHGTVLESRDAGLTWTLLRSSKA